MGTGANFPRSTDAAGQPPAEAGAYVLALRLARPLAVEIGGGGRATLPPGLYLYAGSARGPGGIRARTARHLRRYGGDGTRRHWHIDQLTEAAVEFAVLPVTGGDECALVREILALPGARAPLAGFGSSDCAHCVAHLAAIPESGTLAATLAELAGGRADDIWLPSPDTAAECLRP
jgi:Uri superfamily endonuclease